MVEVVQKINLYCILNSLLPKKIWNRVPNLRSGGGVGWGGWGWAEHPHADVCKDRHKRLLAKRSAHEKLLS
jgi:hypothetical protein